jgi:SSS family solute:Na+ symporter
MNGSRMGLGETEPSRCNGFCGVTVNCVPIPENPFVGNVLSCEYIVALDIKNINAVRSTPPQKFTRRFDSYKKELILSQIVTLLVGVVALLLASAMENVLSLMLYSYAFMVSGLFVPILGGLFWKKSNSNAAFASMIAGGLTTAILQANKITFGTATKMPELRTFIGEAKSSIEFTGINLENLTPGKGVEIINKMQIIDLPFYEGLFKLPLGLDPNVFGILLSAIIFVTYSLLDPKNN